MNIYDVCGDTVEKIESMLPDDVYLGLAILSATMESYAFKNNITSTELWKMLNEIYKEVHEELGNYEG